MKEWKLGVKVVKKEKWKVKVGRGDSIKSVFM